MTDDENDPTVNEDAAGEDSTSVQVPAHRALKEQAKRGSDENNSEIDRSESPREFVRRRMRELDKKDDS